MRQDGTVNCANPDNHPFTGRHGQIESAGAGTDALVHDRRGKTDGEFLFRHAASERRMAAE